MAKKLILVSTIIFFCFFTYSQSPWTKEKGKGLVQASYTFIPEYNQLFLKEGDTFYPSRKIKDNTIQLYSEYGISNNLTATVILPFKIEKTGEISELSTITVNNTTIAEEGSLSGLGNISIALKYKLPTKSFNSSFQIKADLPNYSLDEKTGLATGFNTTTFLPMLSGGLGFDNNNYAFAYAGYGVRTNNYSDFYNIGLEAGHRFFNQLWTILYIDVVQSLYNGTDISTLHNFTQNQIGIYVNNQEFFAWGLKLFEEVNEYIALTAGIGGAFSGNMVAKSPAISLGILYDW